MYFELSAGTEHYIKRSDELLPVQWKPQGQYYLVPTRRHYLIFSSIYASEEQSQFNKIVRWAEENQQNLHKDSFYGVGGARV